MAPRKKAPDAIDPNVPRTRDENRIALRRKVENFYDIQRLRMQTAGRTYKRSDGTEIQLNEIDVQILDRRAKSLEGEEKLALKDVEDHLKTIKFYNEVLNDKKLYRGIGPTMAGVILSSFDIEREDTVSKMCAFAGLRPLPCMRCKSCHAALQQTQGQMTEVKRDDSYTVTVWSPDSTFIHTKERVRTPEPPKPGEEPRIELPKCPHAKMVLSAGGTYESGYSQHPVKGEKLKYNAWLRTKLMGVLAGNLVKLNSPWRKFYDDYKHRKQTAGWGRSDGHRHMAALRYMIKMLLIDIHYKWRTSEGLSVRESYHIAKQNGHLDGGLPSDVLAKAGLLNASPPPGDESEAA